MEPDYFPSLCQPLKGGSADLLTQTLTHHAKLLIPFIHSGRWISGEWRWIKRELEHLNWYVYFIPSASSYVWCQWHKNISVIYTLTVLILCINCFVIFFIFVFQNVLCGDHITDKTFHVPIRRLGVAYLHSRLSHRMQECSYSTQCACTTFFTMTVSLGPVLSKVLEA